MYQLQLGKFLLAWSHIALDKILINVTFLCNMVMQLKHNYDTELIVIHVTSYACLKFSRQSYAWHAFIKVPRDHVVFIVLFCFIISFCILLVISVLLPSGKINKMRGQHFMPLARLIPIMLLKLLCFRVILQDFVYYAPYTYTPLILCPWIWLFLSLITPAT